MIGKLLWIIMTYDSPFSAIEGEVIPEFTKGQIKPKADWRAIDSPQKGESTARQSTYNFV